MGRQFAFKSASIIGQNPIELQKRRAALEYGPRNVAKKEGWLSPV